MADEEVPIDILEAQGGVWDPDVVRGLLQQYFPDETPGEIDFRVNEAVEGAQGWEPGAEFILTIEGAPLPISLGTDPLLIGANIYTWSWAGGSFTDPDLEFSAEERDEFAQNFVDNLAQQQEEVLFNLDDAVGIDEDAVNMLDAAEQQLPFVPGVPPQGDPDLPPGSQQGGSRLRNGLHFRPKRVYYGE